MRVQFPISYHHSLIINQMLQLPFTWNYITKPLIHAMEIKIKQILTKLNVFYFRE